MWRHTRKKGSNKRTNFNNIIKTMSAVDQCDQCEDIVSICITKHSDQTAVDQIRRVHKIGTFVFISGEILVKYVKCTL